MHTEARDTDALIHTENLDNRLCITQRAQSTSQYYFVLQSSHKALPSTTSYYKARTKYFPVPLCTTKLAQSTSQYYFVLQSLHKALPSTTLYYKACTQYVPVLHCTTEHTRNTFHLLTYPYRSLDVAIPIRFTMSTSKRQGYYARSGDAKQPGRSHYNAICGDWVTKHTRTTRSGVKNCSSRSRRQSRETTILKHFLNQFFTGKSPAPKLTKSADKSLPQPWCSHSTTIYVIQLQKTIVLRTQPWRQATLTQPLQCDLQRLSCKTQQNYVQRRQKLQLQNRISTPKPKHVFEALLRN